MIGAGVYGAFLLFALILVTRRLMWRVRRKGFRPSGRAFGDAMQRLQIFAQPEIRWVVEKKDQKRRWKTVKVIPRGPEAVMVNSRQVA